jgi:hypothetical protein
VAIVSPAAIPGSSACFSVFRAGVQDRARRQHGRREERRAEQRPAHLLQHDAEFAEAETLAAKGLGDAHRGQAEFAVELAPGGGLEAGVGRHQAPHLLGGRALAEKPAQAGPEFFLLAGETELHR